MKANDASFEKYETLTDGSIAMLAFVAAVSVANGYYVQPLLLQIGEALGVPAHLLGVLPGLSQIGLAFGLVALLPLADSHSARKVLFAVIPLQICALLLMATASGGLVLMAGSFLIGLFGVTPYVLPPFASLRVPATRLGHTTGRLSRGVISGILLARSIAGVVAVHFGWRYVYFFAVVAMMGMLGVVARIVKPQKCNSSVSYKELLASLLRLFRKQPALRVAAACQWLSFSSFNVFWIGSSFYLNEKFHWKADAIGYVGVLGAFAAFFAPWIGKLADRVGPAKTRIVALTAMVAGWCVFAFWSDNLPVMAMGLIVLDVGAAVADISNRTLLYLGDREVRTRVNAVYQIAMFGGASVMSAFVGIVWYWRGWPAVCLFGGGCAGLSGLIAWRYRHYS
ncbi:MFS transporter [Paraburkholderia caribensis]|uniref:MFS transporter n=1 Tax=Paraburkholderia caribensis TaxID=75105 RepID=UPI00078B6F67|nr:MFS transporter [Paraburkholderia caribensis]AMV48479.1 hypothetical protein ATN79_48410 [Paraburkholderia caribensis]